MITVTVQGTNEIIQDLTTPNIDVLNRAMIFAITGIAINMQMTAPFKTGKLAQSIKPIIISPFEAHVISDSSYVDVQRYGTTKKDYPISPKVKKALYWPGLGHPIPRVPSHPGIKGKRFDSIALQQSTQFIDYLAQAVEGLYTIRG